jgi:hypothetical protein
MWASHQLLVGIPVIIIRQSGSIVAGVSSMGNTGEQLHRMFFCGDFYSPKEIMRRSLYFGQQGCAVTNNSQK